MINGSVAGLHFDEFEIERVTSGPHKGQWHMRAVWKGINIEQMALHMSPATIYNFSVRAATEAITVSARLAVTERQIIN